MSKDMVGELMQLRHSSIDIGERARKEFNEDSLKELGLDIWEHGLHHPIVVLDKFAAGLTDTQNGVRPYLLLAGERRYRATLMMVREYTIAEREDEIPDHIRRVPCKVYRRQMSDKEIKIIELSENAKREDFTFQEKARLTEEIHNALDEVADISHRGKKKKHTARNTADFMNVSEGTVSQDRTIAAALNSDDAILKAKVEKATTKAKALKEIKKHKEAVIAAEISRRVAMRQSKGGDKLTNIAASYLLTSFQDGMSEIEDRSIDFIELDPDYGIGFRESGPARQGTRDSAEDYIEIPPEEYETEVQAYAEECYRVLKDNSWMIVWYAIGPWHDTTRKIFEEAGFNVAPIPAFWYKMTGNSSTPAYQLGNEMEFFFYCRKGVPRLAKMGRNNVFKFRVPTQSERFHPAEKPIELYEEIFDTFVREGARAIVGFAGSGNAILAGHNRGLDIRGFDLSEPYKQRFDSKVLSSQGEKFKTYKSEIVPGLAELAKAM